MVDNSKGDSSLKWRGLDATVAGAPGAPPDHYLFGTRGRSERVEHTAPLSAEVCEQVASTANHDPERTLALLTAAVSLLTAAYLQERDAVYLCSPTRSDESGPELAGSIIRVEIGADSAHRDIVVKAHRAIQHTRFSEPVKVADLPMMASERDEFLASVTRVGVALLPLHGHASTLALPSELVFRFELASDGVALACCISKSPGCADSVALKLAFEHLESVLGRICRHPQQSAFASSAASAADRAFVLGEFNPPSLHASASGIHRELEARVDRWPDRLAVFDGRIRLTYAEFELRANALAARLQSMGLQAGERAGVLMHRSIDLVVSLFAVLKLGATYVPLDPGSPAPRLAGIASEAGLRLIVTQPELEEKARVAAERLIVREEMWRELLEGDVPRISVATTRATVAYIIFTSGSTGRPKGVVISHAEVLSTVTAFQAEYPVTSSDVVLARTPHVFDVSFAELLGWFWDGGALAVLPLSADHDIHELIGAIEVFGVTHAAFVPSLFDVFAAGIGARDIQRLASLRYVVLCGEVVRAESVERMRKLGCRATFVNAYGPTEASVYCSSYLIPDGLGGSVPIGRPLSNAKLFVLHESREIQPVGVPGQLYIAGSGVSRGYLNDPERTEAAFSVCPFEKGQRMYASGDMAYVRPDGNLIFLGRRDSQVKVRGFRVELGEVERALLAQPGVIECAVIADKDAVGQSHVLIAFVAVDGSAAGKDIVSAAEARLGATLPAYMLPQRSHLIDRLPRTASGKVDRGALLVRDQKCGQEARQGLVSTTVDDTDEATILEVLRGHTACATLAVDEDVFRAGATSLQATAAAARLAERFPLRAVDVFARPNARALAKLARERRLASDIGEAARISAGLLDFTRASTEPAKPEIAHREELLHGIPRPLRHVFVTGATGHLGAHLIRALIARGARVTALVRADGPAGAAARLSAALRHYFPRWESRAEQLTCRAGDLELGGPLRDELRDAGYDAVFHAAANVRHWGDEAAFARSNVEGTQRLLDALRGSDTAFHYVSTIGVHEALEDGTLFEACAVLRRDPGNPYLRSKVAAEQSVRGFAAEGGDVAIYRVGNLVFDSRSGCFQRNIDESAFYQQLRALWRLGAIPAGATAEIEMTPVDVAADAMVRLAANRYAEPRAFHVYNDIGVTMNSLVAAFERGGASFERIASAREMEGYVTRWLAEMSRADRQQVLLFLSSVTSAPRRVDSSLTRARLARCGFSWPELSDAALDRMVQHMQQVGFIAARAA